MQIEKPNNRRIAKNAMMLTLRMVIVSLVGLYTSRVVLASLGDIDYGIYGAVGGIIALGSFLNTSMAGATTRFITYELGKNDIPKLQSVFSTSILIHFTMALIVILFAETFGLWFLNNQMSFPTDKMFAVNVLYQLTVASALVSFTQVPYNAVILAHERMGIYAYFEIIFVSLKLLVVFSLAYIDSNILIYYGILMFLVSTLNALLYRWYCIRNFKEARFCFKIKRNLVKDMCTFFGLDLYGNMSVVVSSNSQPILLNIFFGVLSNTGATIASTVNGILMGLVNTIALAFKPQVTKQYAAGNIKEMTIVMLNSLKFTTLAYSALVIPFMIAAPIILNLWLGQVPAYTVIFLKITMLCTFFGIILNVIAMAIHATGCIWRISFINGTLYLLTPIISYLLFKIGFPAWTIYMISTIISGIACIFGFCFIRIQIPSIPIKQVVSVLIKSYLCILVSFIIIKFINNHTAISIYATNDSFISSILYITIISMLGVVLLSSISYYCIFTAQERLLFSNKIRTILSCMRFKISNY